MKLHLKKDLGIYKTSLRKNINDAIDMVSYAELINEQPELVKANKLIQRKGDYYTISETKTLMGFYITSHDECVWDNEEDFNPLQVYTANRKMKKFEEVMNLIKKFEQIKPL